MTKDVTVVIMSYNNASFLAQTVSSALAQEGPSLEVIVFDDCSSDDSVQILEQFSTDGRFRYHVNERNLGLTDNYNQCVRAGTGRYVVVLGSDDVLYPGHLASLCTAMDAMPGAMLGYTQCDWIDSEGRFIRRAVHPGHAPDSYRGGRDEIAGLLSHDNYITPSAMILRRDMLDDVALPNGSLAREGMLAGDWDLWLRIAREHPDFVFLNQASVGYRIHSGQVSKKFYADARPLFEHTDILEHCLDDDVFLPRVRSAVLPIWLSYQNRLNAYPESVRRSVATRVSAIRQRLFCALTAPADEDGPKFSVIVTTYNRPDLLRDTLSSLRAQSCRDFEVVLVNDHGVSVENLLVDYSDLALVYFDQPSNQGLSAARNAALLSSPLQFPPGLDGAGELTVELNTRDTRR